MQNLFAWQYLFTRGIVIFLLLNLYLFFEEGKEFYKNYLKIGYSGIIGGLGLGCAMISFIWSITIPPQQSHFCVYPRCLS